MSAVDSTPRAPFVSPAPRNPGPSWGYQFFRACDRLLPEVVFRPLRAAGAWVALGLMSRQRRHSREYLRAVLAHEPSLRDCFRHFFAFTETLLLKLRVGHGHPHQCRLAADADGFREWLDDGYPVLLGTFHVGPSDLLGFVLAQHKAHRVHLVRLQVGNSYDIEQLAARTGDRVRFIWVNDPRELLFALKTAAESEGAIGLQCDRIEHSARTEPFTFLGARRLFPVTIYELARLFQRPVILLYGVPDGPNASLLQASNVFRPEPGESRAAGQQRAHEHFQAFLHRLEGTLRTQPYLWFNFTALNPPAVPPPS